ncbi:hypothetical protein P2H44_12695 [Albimonas sp. CAU 1670]|uniref:hypothetical protein n=1 Tax=Albimonas sp. CAU 1670 TaxID=3032599 RepID=UPI0023DA93AD|nr:hypothetical protein [Albimonas sp. CAU 1670]MDF2233412.1 hypothetical protein [Albimonas sp. CAU 1670]
MSRPPLLRFAAALAVLVGLAGPAAALSVQINFGGGDAGGAWNNIVDTQLEAGAIALTDTTGTASGLTLDGTGQDWRNLFADETSAGEDWVSDIALDMSVGQEATMTLVVSGLENAPLSVQLVSSRDCCEYEQSFSINGVAADATYRGATVGATWGAKTDGTAPLDWLVWSSLTPTDGTLTLTLTSLGSFAMVNALRLGDAMDSGAQVPVPAAGLLLLGGLGMLGAAARRPRAA